MLDHRSDVMASVRRLNDGRDRMIAAMERLGFRTLHAKGNFMHVAFGDLGPAIHAALKDAVLYRLDHKEPCLKGFTRFSATTFEGFQPLIERIEQVVHAAGVNRSVYAQ
jgi:histidinol-phosphate aminotransferase